MGTLHLKHTAGGKTQMIIRADTNLGKSATLTWRARWRARRRSDAACAVPSRVAQETSSSTSCCPPT